MTYTGAAHPPPTVDGVRERWSGIGAVVLTVPWICLILVPQPGPSVLHPVPFQELPWYLSAPIGVVIVQVGGNLAVFAGFGALAPVQWRLATWQVAGLAAVGSVTVESLQYLLDLGRVASVDDVLLNTGGAVLAAQLTRRRWRPDPRKSGATLCR